MWPVQHVDKRGDLLNKGGKGSVDTVKASAAIRKDLKELEALKSELSDIHAAEEKKALKKAPAARERAAPAARGSGGGARGGGTGASMFGTFRMRT